MREVGLTEKYRVLCDGSHSQQCRKRLVQVPFVAMCEAGHLQDFPWREWVHRDAGTQCTGRLRLRGTGSASLSGMAVYCECSARRSLAGITYAGEDGTALTNQLQEANPYTCRGRRPWLGPGSYEPCDRPLRASLRHASNLYYANVVSSLYLPSSTREAPGEPCSLPGGDEDSAQVDLRKCEFGILCEGMESDELVVKSRCLSEYGHAIAKYFSRVCLVPSLRETRVFTGFSRVVAGDASKPMLRQLYRHVPTRPWLPAYVVHGEGLFLEFRPGRLQEWLSVGGSRLTHRSNAVAERLARSGMTGDLELSPQLLLVHTFSHLLLNTLTFECGYSSASLRERLYVSTTDGGETKAGILIYTAAGDSDGTMGGLVRMGMPGRLESIITAAIEKARWCSADPVCMETGDSSGQGPESCNLAACHNCALVPETACELFNRFLDRGVVVGTMRYPDTGYFA